MLDQRKNSVADASAVLSSLPTDTASLQNQIQILTSRDLAGEVVDKLASRSRSRIQSALLEQPVRGAAQPATLDQSAKWFKPRPLPGTAEAAAERAQVIDAVLRRLSVDTVGLSTSIAVRFAAEDAEKAAQASPTPSPAPMSISR